MVCTIKAKTWTTKRKPWGKYCASNQEKYKGNQFFKIPPWELKKKSPFHSPTEKRNPINSTNSFAKKALH